MKSQLRKVSSNGYQLVENGIIYGKVNNQLKLLNSVILKLSLYL